MTADGALRSGLEHDQLKSVTAQLLIELAFLVPRGTDLAAHPISEKLKAFARATRESAVADLLRAQPPDPTQKLVEVWQKKRPDECDHVFNLADWSDREIVGRICWKCGEKQPFAGRAQPPPAPDPPVLKSVWTTDGHTLLAQFYDYGYFNRVQEALLAAPPAVEGTRTQEQGESRVDGSTHGPTTGSTAKTTTGGRS